jgi:HSP20 family protein
MALPSLMFGRRREAAPATRDPFTSLRHEMERLFDEFRGVGGGLYSAFESSFTPAIDISETDKGIELTAELPGIDEKDVEVTLADNVLTLKGEKKVERNEKGKDFHLVERSHGSFMRAVPLPFEVDEAKVAAQFKNGVLKVTLPMAADAERKTRKIPVKSG